MVLEKPLSGKIALITGGNRGIGLAIARRGQAGRAAGHLPGAIVKRCRPRSGELQGAGYDATPLSPT